MFNPPPQLLPIVLGSYCCSKYLRAMPPTPQHFTPNIHKKSLSQPHQPRGISNLFFSITHPPHRAGITASLSREQKTPHHPLIRHPMMSSSASSSVSRGVASPVKNQRKRKAHAPDSESDGDNYVSSLLFLFRNDQMYANITF